MKAEDLSFPIEFFPTSAQSHTAERHQDSGNGHHPDQLKRINGGQTFQGCSLDSHQTIDRDTFRMWVNAGQNPQHRGTVAKRFAHADDSTAAERDSGTTHALQCFQPLLIGSGGDDPVVMLRTGVEVVVVGRESCFGQTLRLRIGEHSCSDTGFKTQLTHPSNHPQHRLKGRSFTDLPPGPAHAKAIGTGSGRCTCPVQDRLHLQIGLTTHITAVVHRLGAVGTVLLAATGLDAQQRSQLNPVPRIGGPVHALGAPEQIHQRQVKQGLDLLKRPVVA